MFYVHGNTVFKVLEDLRKHTFRDVFWKGEESEPWEATVRDFWDFWAPRGSQKDSNFEEMYAFLRSGISMIFGVSEYTPGVWVNLG